MFMRKEVRLGLSIGGVLLAVLIVYVLVVTAGSDKPQTVTLDQPTNSTGPNTSGPGGRPDAPAPPAPEQQARRDEPRDAGRDRARDSTAATAPSGDRWNDALSTGRVSQPPVLMTETPGGGSPQGSGASPAPIPPGPAAANQSTPQLGGGTATTSSGTLGGSVPIAASNQGAIINSAGNNPGGYTSPIPSGPATLPSARDTSVRTHVVQPGETYASIAKAVYGNESYYPHLIRANPTIEARRLRPGMTINVPPSSEVRADTTSRPGSTGSPQAAAQSAAPQAALDPRTEYRVGEGDSLEKISLKLYGKRDRTEKLYELNKATIGADPARLKIGMVLKLPEAPTTMR
jgi:nucleoid-associated protein YgaU